MPITRMRTKSRMHLADITSTSRREIAISYVYTRTVEHRIHISRAEVAMRPCGEIYGLYPHRCGDLYFKKQRPRQHKRAEAQGDGQTESRENPQRPKAKRAKAERERHRPLKWQTQPSRAPPHGA